MTPVQYRLQISHALWVRACTQLHTRQRQLAWGRVHRSTHGRVCDLLVHQLQWSDQPPYGPEFSQGYDFAIIDDPWQRTALHEYESLMRSVQLRAGQLLVYVQPGSGGQLDQWVGAVLFDNQLQPLQQIRLVGQGMQVFRRQHQQSSESASASAERIDTRQSQRWSRLSGAMEPTVFRRFRSLEVLLVGAGRVGSLFAATLVRMGLRNLSILDPDVLEEHNRDCTVGNRPRDVGRPKVESLLRHLHTIRPRATLRGMTAHAQEPTALQLLRRCSAIFVCVDNDEARLHLTRLASHHLKVTLDLGTAVRLVEHSATTRQREISADVRLILPGSCLSCVGGLDIDSSTTRQGFPQFTAGERYSELEGDHKLPTSVPEKAVWSRDGRVGSLPSINHLAVGTALQMWIDLLSEQIETSFWTRMRWVQGEGLQSLSRSLTGRKDCPVCGGRGR